MKKTILFFSVITAFLSFVACSNEDDSLIEQSEQSQPQTGKMTFWATGAICTGDESDAKATRTQFKENSISDVIWSKTDKIHIGSKEYSLVSGDGETTGKFEGDALDAPKPGGLWGTTVTTQNYDAFYYGLSKESFPNEQSYNNRQIVSYVPMSATVTINSKSEITKDVEFTNLCGLLRITIKGPNTKKIKSITVSADQKMAGAISSFGTSSAKYLQIDLTNGTNYITLNCGNGVALNPDKGTDFYIVIPVAYTKRNNSVSASTYSNFRIAITDDKDETITKKLNGTLSVTQSKIIPITFNSLYTFKGGDVDVTGTTEKFDRTTLDDSAWGD